MHGVLWQLFKQPRSPLKGRCLQWSESCLFSSGRCFPASGLELELKWLFTRKTQVWKPQEWSGKEAHRGHTLTVCRVSVCAVCVCVFFNRGDGEAEGGCDKCCQMSKSPWVVILVTRHTPGCGCQESEQGTGCTVDKKNKEALEEKKKTKKKNITKPCPADSSVTFPIYIIFIPASPWHGRADLFALEKKVFRARLTVWRSWQPFRNAHMCCYKYVVFVLTHGHGRKPSWPHVKTRASFFFFFPS